MEQPLNVAGASAQLYKQGVLKDMVKGDNNTFQKHSTAASGSNLPQAATQQTVSTPPSQVNVHCNGLRGTLLITTQAIICKCPRCQTPGGPQGGRVMTPTEFERHSGMQTSKKWRRSIKVDTEPESTNAPTGGMCVGRWLEQNGFSLHEGGPRDTHHPKGRHDKGRGQQADTETEDEDEEAPARKLPRQSEHTPMPRSPWGVHSSPMYPGSMMPPPYGAPRRIPPLPMLQLQLQAAAAMQRQLHRQFGSGGQEALGMAQQLGSYAGVPFGNPFMFGGLRGLGGPGMVGPLSSPAAMAAMLQQRFGRSTSAAPDSSEETETECLEDMEASPAQGVKQGPREGAAPAMETAKGLKRDRLEGRQSDLRTDAPVLEGEDASKEGDNPGREMQEVVTPMPARLSGASLTEEKPGTDPESTWPRERKSSGRKTQRQQSHMQGSPSKGPDDELLLAAGALELLKSASKSSEGVKDMKPEEGSDEEPGTGQFHMSTQGKPKPPHRLKHNRQGIVQHPMMAPGGYPGVGLLPWMLDPLQAAAFQQQMLAQSGSPMRRRLTPLSEGDEAAADHGDGTPLPAHLRARAEQNSANLRARQHANFMMMMQANRAMYIQAAAAAAAAAQAQAPPRAVHQGPRPSTPQAQIRQSRPGPSN